MNSSCDICRRWRDYPSLRVTELDFCYVTLFPDQFFYGYLLLHTKQHYVEPYELPLDEYELMMSELRRVAEILNKVVRPTKINYQLLGNMVPHIHWHLTPRYEDDPLWPKPHWVSPHSPLELSSERRCELITKLRAEFGAA